MTTLAGLLLAIAGWWLGGIALLTLCIRRSDAHAEGSRHQLLTAETLGTGLLVGIVASTWLSFVWSLAGGSLDRPFSLGLAGLGIAAGVAALWRSFARRSTLVGQVSNLSVNSEHQPELLDPDRLETCPTDPRELASACHWLIGGLFVVLLSQSLLTPQRLWDERAIYAIKAKVLFEDQSVNSPALLHPDFVQYHPRYPLLLPLAKAHLYQCLGRVDDRWAKVVPPLLYLGIVPAFAGVIGRQFTSGFGWLIALLLATVPCLMPWEYGFLSAQADAPLAALHGASVLYLWDALRNANCGQSLTRSLILAGLFAGGALFTKDEGLAFALMDGGLVLCAGVWLAIRRGGAVRQLLHSAVPSLIALVMAAPWFWHRRRLPDTTEMTYFSRLSLEAVQAGWPTLAWSVPHVLRQMFSQAWLWGLHWWGMLVSALLCPARALSLPQLFLCLDVAGAIAALLLAGMLSPTPVEEHIGGSAHRYLMQISPVAVLFLAGQWGKPAATRE
jgi:hypothetical protein